MTDLGELLTGEEVDCYPDGFISVSGCTTYDESGCDAHGRKSGRMIQESDLASVRPRSSACPRTPEHRVPVLSRTVHRLCGTRVGQVHGGMSVAWGALAISWQCLIFQGAMSTGRWPN